VVCSTRGRSVGLVVDAIVDIVEGVPTGHGVPVGTGPLGSAVVQRRITELLDVEQAVREADPGFYELPGVPARGGP
jgi:two-component system chemotaxis sensor kinase CheA